MCQEQIYNFLRRNRGRWCSSAEMSRRLNLPRQTVNTGLRRLRKYSEVREKKMRVLLRGKLGVIPKEVSFYSYKEF